MVNEDFRPPLGTLYGTLGDSKPYELFLPYRIDHWRPILRGSRGEGGNDRFSLELETYQNGVMEYVLLVRSDPEKFGISPHWLMGLLGNALCAAERFRGAAGAPEIEYGLELEVAVHGGPLHIGRYGPGLDIDDRLGPFPKDAPAFPRYSIGPVEEFQEVTRLFHRDFWNTAGHDLKEVLTVDYERALREFAISV